MADDPNSGGVSNSTLGGWLTVGGDVLSGIGDFMGSQAEASQLKFQQRNVEAFTALQEYMQKRQAYQVQSRAQADIAANGLADSGSAQEILRMNAQNLALDAGIINYQGGLKAGQLGMEARAAETQGYEQLASGIIKGAASAAGAGLI